MTGAWSIWYASFSFSAMGEKLIGSQPRLLQKSGDPDARFFQTEGYTNTGVYNTYDGMLGQIEIMLNDLAELSRTVVYLHHVRLMNFDRLGSQR